MARQKNKPLHVAVYPSNFEDGNGQKMLYVSANAHGEATLEELDAFCHESEGLPRGYVARCFDALMYAIPKLMGEHKRVKTPIGSFFVKPQFFRTMTDNEKVTAADIAMSGIDFRPTQAFKDAVSRQFGSIEIDRRHHPKSLEYYSKPNEALTECLVPDSIGSRYVTIDKYRKATGLGYNTAKKCLDRMTEGEHPVLKRTKIGRTNVYVEA